VTAQLSYDSPLFRRFHRAVAPNGSAWAEVAEAFEVSMSNPTAGKLHTSMGLSLDNCNPSFLWSDDSRYLTVPQFARRFGCLRVQRLLVIDVTDRIVHACSTTAFYFQPETFENGVLTVTREPFGAGERLSWKIPNELAHFRVVQVSW
jgi:hypothetical protein